MTVLLILPHPAPSLIDLIAPRPLPPRTTWPSSCRGPANLNGREVGNPTLRAGGGEEEE